MTKSFLGHTVAALVLALAAGCSAATVESSAGGKTGSTGGGGRGGTNPGGGGDGGLRLDLPDANPDPPFTGGGDAGLTVPLTGFTPAESGAYKLGPAPSKDETATVSTPNGCNTLIGLVRDFKGDNEDMGHPDFERYSGGDATPGLVAPQLGSDRKPVYASQCERGGTGNGPLDKTICPYGAQTTSKASFDQWYRTTEGVNKPFLLYLSFAQNNGTATFRSDTFFPLDDAGFGNSGEDEQNKLRNFGFTTELHTNFKYSGGEHFTFSGDDDLWVFINQRLALDLGGLHPAVDGTIDLDASAGKLGIAKGGTYSLELFHAERHTDASHFRVDTNFVFVDCGRIVE
jgi:fibro-slime domain-containing protein